MCIHKLFRAFFALPLLFFVMPISSAQAAAPEAAKQEVVLSQTERILTLPDYWEVATPKQAAALLAGQSLKELRMADKYNPLSRTPLALAARVTTYPEIIDLLVKAGSAVDARVDYRTTFWRPGRQRHEDESEDLATALHFAVLNPNPAALRGLLRHKPDLNARDDDGRHRMLQYSALELAALRPGRTEHLRLLLEAGARPVPAPALTKPETYSLWRYFLGYGRFDPWALHAAPLNRLHDASGTLLSPEETAAKTKLLLAHGIRPDADALGRALVTGHNETARLLLAAGVNPGATIEGKSMLLHALSRRRANSSNQDDRRYTPPAPDVNIIRALIRAAGNLQGQPELLTRACESGVSAEIARMLVAAGAPYSTEGNGLIFAALSSEHDRPDLVAYLLELGFSAQDQGGGGLSPLRAAAQPPWSKPKSAQLLVKGGASAEQINTFIRGNPEFAAQIGVVDAAGEVAGAAELPDRDRQRLLAEKVKIMELARVNPEAALFWPAFYSVATPDEVREIIGKRSFYCHKTVKKQVPAYYHGMDVLEALPFVLFDKAFWTGKRRVRKDFSALVEAVHVTPYPEVVHTLVAAGCKSTDLNSQALHMALYNPNPAVLGALLAHKPDLRVQDAYLGMTLHRLAATEPAVFQREHFRLLLEVGADPNGIARQNKETPLMRAAFYRNTEAGRLLLAAGARTDIISRVGDTALGIAVGREAYELAREILRIGSPLTGSYHPPLIALAKNKTTDFALARDLVAAIGAESFEATEAIGIAARRGHVETLRSLLEAGAGAGDRKKTALNAALLVAVSKHEHQNEFMTVSDKPAIVALLLQYGANPAARFQDLDEETLRRWRHWNGATSASLEASALHLTALYGLPQSAALLLKAGAPAEGMKGSTADTPLFGAAYLGSSLHDPQGYEGYDRQDHEGRVAVAKRLVAAGADPFRENAGGFSPFLLGLGNPELTKLFLKNLPPSKRSVLDAPASSGGSPLTMAASHSRNADAIPLLLAAGANRDKPDGKGRRALDVALEKENGRAVAYLMAR